MSTSDWVKAGIDLLQAIISGVVVGFVIFWLDERRATRDRRLADFRIASNWNKTEPRISLRNFDLTKTNLSGRNFFKADLESTVFEKAIMWGTDFSEANLRAANFQKTNLVGVKFKAAMVYRVDFSRATISRRTYPDIEYLPDFTNAVLHRVKFNHATIHGASFLSANLEAADFSHAHIWECDFSNANLTDTKWEMANVENCIWKNVVIGNPANYPMYLLDEIRQQNSGNTPDKNQVDSLKTATK